MEYTKEDKYCSHCGGDISPHSCGVDIIYWCNDCGSNNKDCPPNVELKFSK